MVSGYMKLDVNIGAIHDNIYLGPEIAEKCWIEFGDAFEESCFWDECYSDIKNNKLKKLSKEECDELFDTYMYYKEELADLENFHRSLALYCAIQTLHPEFEYKKKNGIKQITHETLIDTIRFLNQNYRNQSFFGDIIKQLINQNNE